MRRRDRVVFQKIISEINTGLKMMGDSSLDVAD